MISEAMIFAAGLGKRMYPLSIKIPKPLLKINRKSLLSNNIDKLIESKVKNIVVNAYKHPNQILKETRNYSENVTVIKEKNRLETGGGFLNAIKQNLFQTNNPVILINGDIFWINKYYNSINIIRKLWNPEKMDMLLSLKRKEDLFGYGGNGDFDFYSSKTRLLELKKKPNSPLVFTGLQIVKQEVVLKKKKFFFSIKEQIIDSGKKRRLYGYIDKNPWFHIGTVKDLESFKVDQK